MKRRPRARPRQRDEHGRRAMATQRELHSSPSKRTGKSTSETAGARAKNEETRACRAASEERRALEQAASEESEERSSRRRARKHEHPAPRAKNEERSSRPRARNEERSSRPRARNEERSRCSSALRFSLPLSLRSSLAAGARALFVLRSRPVLERSSFLQQEP